jgi:microcystin-dependent protein
LSHGAHAPVATATWAALTGEALSRRTTCTTGARLPQISLEVKHTARRPAAREPSFRFARALGSEGRGVLGRKEISRANYANLFAAIGTLHGAGDGTTTFRVPDYRGRFLRGVDQGQGRDPNAGTRTAMASGGATGDDVGTLQGGATARPSTAFVTSTTGAHSHQAPTWNGIAGPYEVAGGGYGYDFGAQAPPTTVNGDHAHTIVAGGDSETRPLNAGVNFIIKY